MYITKHFRMVSHARDPTYIILGANNKHYKHRSQEKIISH